jgi:hypothetical protein
MSAGTLIGTLLEPASQPLSICVARRSWLCALRSLTALHFRWHERHVHARLTSTFSTHHASQRVLRSLLLAVSGSHTFLNCAFGFNIGSLHRSRQRVDLALFHSAQMKD